MNKRKRNDSGSISGSPEPKRGSIDEEDNETIPYAGPKVMARSVARRVLNPQVEPPESPTSGAQGRGNQVVRRQLNPFFDDDEDGWQKVAGKCLMKC